MAGYAASGLAPTEAEVAQSPPGPALARHVLGYFRCDGGSDASPLTVRTLPDGCVDLTIDFSGPRPRAFVSGPRTRAGVYRHRGAVHLVGAQFLPGGARPLLDVDALTEAWVPLDELLGRPGAALAEQIAEAPSPAARIATLERFLVARLAERPPDSRVAGAVSRLVESEGALPVARLSRESGASERNLVRLFREWVGLSPKRLGRIIRFQFLLKRIAVGATIDWATLALDAGYADQSHLVREFADFAGLSPTHFLRRSR
jgi:AraC-like DNA-binding protein